MRANMSKQHDVTINQASDPELHIASKAALASLLNLTFLPGIAFVWLLIKFRRAEVGNIAHYHLSFAIKLNLLAFFALVAVTTMMLLLGGFDSAWTWVYVITYFTLVHTAFILIGVWAMVRSWSGQHFSES
jgi:hypothetical protein